MTIRENKPFTSLKTFFYLFSYYLKIEQMSKSNFKYIRAGYEEGMPAHINFYDDVTNWSADDFIYEFQYLEKYVNPSEIVVHINSVGGSVVDGISIFSIIQNCKIKTKTINDGLAASMGSVIWAAGKEMYMKDYGLLMIHNPFNPNSSSDKEDSIEAFKKQLSIIYQKRFGFSEETVKSIMDGEEGKDGTWYTAKEAVEAGFIDGSHVIETSEAEREKAKASINGTKNLKEIAHIMASIGSNATMPKKNTKLNHNTAMENNFILVAAQLGMPSDKASEASVQARIKELLASEASLAQVKAELKKSEDTVAELRTQITGKETAVQNLTKNLEDAKSKLKVFEDAEAAAKNAEIEALVDAAIKTCKISKEDRATWISQAKTNLDLTKQVLDSIPARTDISAAIADDPQNHHDAKEGMTDAEKEIQAKLDASVGPNFKFNTWKN